MLDLTDKTILRHLQNNGKKTIRELSVNLKMTTSPVFERIKDMEKEGVIKKYVALADHKKIDRGQIVFCNVTMSDYSTKTISNFEQEVAEMPEVLECYHFAGEVDYQLKVLVKDIDAYYEFLQAFADLPMVKVHSSIVVLKEVKYSTEIPV
ncbi:MAG: Lrp/AsnC family transcriptional regulator [Bacteroidota bacterium]